MEPTVTELVAAIEDALKPAINILRTQFDEIAFQAFKAGLVVGLDHARRVIRDPATYSDTKPGWMDQWTLDEWQKILDRAEVRS